MLIFWSSSFSAILPEISNTSITSTGIAASSVTDFVELSADNPTKKLSVSFLDIVVLLLSPSIDCNVISPSTTVLSVHILPALDVSVSLPKYSCQLFIVLTSATLVTACSGSSFSPSGAENNVT